MLDVYRTYYKMTGEPFRLSPDHRFSLAHNSYANAKAYLQYAIYQGEGFIAVTGGPGTGKTTLIGDLIEGVDKENIEVATLTTTQLESRDLLQMVANLFDLHPEDTSKPGLLLELEQFLNKQSHKGRRVILIVDEAQGLTKAALEELRLLANLQRNHQLLLQVFLVGQDQLLEMLRAPGMEQLHQRLIAASHLKPLGLDEVIDYVEHRLSRVGWKDDPGIDEGTLRLIYKYSGGIPRKINLICNRLFLYGGLEQKHELVVEDARLVIDELHKEFLLSSGLTDESEHDEVIASDDGTDTPVRHLPRKNMNAAPAKVSEDKPSEDKPSSPDPEKEPEEKAFSETRTQPKIVKPVPEKVRRDKKPPAQVAPDRVVGSKNRIEPTMRRDPYIGLPKSKPVHKSEPLWKNRSLGKIAAVVILAGFVYVTFFGSEDANVEDAFNDTSEMKPHAAFSTPLETDTNPDKPALDVGTMVRVPEKMEEPVDAGMVATEVVSTTESPVDSDADAKTGTPATRSGQEETAAVVSVLPSLPEPVARERKKESVTPAEPPAVKKPVETIKHKPVKTAAKAVIEAEKARLQREAELRLAMNLNTGGDGRKKAVPAPVKIAPVKAAPTPTKKLTPAPVSSKPEVPVEAPVPIKVPIKVATAPKIKTAPKKRSPLDLLKAALLEGQWTSRGKPASLLPSKVTYCNSQGTRIACESIPQDINTKYGAALYKVETTLQEFSAERSFQLSYRTLVKLLKDDSKSTREAALSSNTDWQISDYDMSCRLTQPDQVKCRDNRGITRDYRRSKPAVMN